MIIRAKRSTRFTVVPNNLLEDSDLDWKDLGLLVYLLSKPDNWEISVEHLKKQRKLGRDGIYKCLDSIIASGYARREKKKDGSVDWYIFDEKTNQEEVKEPNTENTEKAVDSLIRKSRNTENPNPENTTQVNTDIKQELINKTKTDLSIAREGFDRFYSAYPRKIAKEDAIKAWKKIPEKLYQVIIDAVVERTSKNGWAEKEFIIYPATYLNGKRWEDEILTVQKSPNSATNRNSGFAKQPQERPVYTLQGNRGAIDSTAEILHEHARL